MRSRTLIKSRKVFANHFSDDDDLLNSATISENDPQSLAEPGGLRRKSKNETVLSIRLSCDTYIAILD